MSGGIAALAAGFGEYLERSSRSSRRRTSSFSVPLGARSWNLTGGGVAGVLAIVFLTAVNFAGVREGAWIQNLVTVVKLAALAALAGVGLFASAPVHPRPRRRRFRRPCSPPLASR